MEGSHLWSERAQGRIKKNEWTRLKQCKECFGKAEPPPRQEASKEVAKQLGFTREGSEQGSAIGPKKTGTEEQKPNH